MTILYIIQYNVCMNQEDHKLLERLIQELKRGNLTIAVMNRLSGREHYGYSLLQELTQCGLDIHQDTLYPMLRRLEQQNLIESRWELESSRPRKYYSLSSSGREVYQSLVEAWLSLEETIRSMII